MPPGNVLSGGIGRPCPDLRAGFDDVEEAGEDHAAAVPGALGRPAPAAGGGTEKPDSRTRGLADSRARGLAGSADSRAQRNRDSGTVFRSPGREPMKRAIALSSASVKFFTWPAMMALARPTAGLPSTL